MSERSLETLISYLDEPPEMDSDQEDLEDNVIRGIYESSKIEIIDSIGTDEFKYIWLTLNDDIKYQNGKLQRIFSEQTLDKIYEVYDFSFPENISLDDMFEIRDFYKFLEFLEYENTTFISYVWNFLKVDDIISLDVDKFCKKNADQIIKEVEEQLDIHRQNKLITKFLRTYYKEKFIEWFIKNTEKSIIDIAVSLSERKE